VIDNALRFAPPDSAIEVTIRHRVDGVEITIADSGPGVAEEDLPWIFNRFWRGDKARSRASGGAGLGLAIARQLTEAQGGRIEVRSEHGRGSTFLVHIPQPGLGDSASRGEAAGA